MAQLHILNTLTGKKDLFVPANGNTINWYICGPTVYDSSHMGHARSYLSFDIIRRILQDYFHYDVIAVMNITDVDDKIIIRARQNFLFERYVAAHPTLDSELVSDIKTIGKELSVSSESSADVLNSMRDMLITFLDEREGATVTDHSILQTLSIKYEREYLEDMNTLNVQPPHVLTRVSEYIPEIIKYIERIIANGFGYIANGSVYFDINAFETAGHQYCKLSKNNIDDSESSNPDKRNNRDFVLWKKAKFGELKWGSPWGDGRPGWHIECSAMASDILGSKCDIHGGGIDLMFPHHDNELAQAEAFYGCNQWVNYFIHAGHLHIDGQKMSKSLKNFITIRQALTQYTARQIRILFLLHPWSVTLDYSNNTMNEAVVYDKSLKEFFMTINDLLRHQSTSEKWTDADRELNTVLRTAKNAAHDCLADSFDTKGVMNIIQELMKSTNIYIRNQSIKPFLLKAITDWINSILTLFGLIDNVNFPYLSSTTNSASIVPVAEALSVFRDKVRAVAKSSKPPIIDLLMIADELRDEVLPELGIRLEDRPEGSIIKLDDRDVLLRERDNRLKARKKVTPK